MGKRGPPPKPSAVKKKAGTYRKDRAATNEMAPPTAVPVMPRGLDATARAAWRRIVPQLQELGVLARIDAVALESYCSAYSDAIHARKVLRREGRYIATSQGLSAHPALKDEQAAWARVDKIGAQFGLTPSARTRVSAEPKKQTDSAEAFLFGDQGLKVVDGGKA